jgi:hypothetical protein
LLGGEKRVEVGLSVERGSAADRAMDRERTGRRRVGEGGEGGERGVVSVF